jgi:hypothetical protein
MTTDNSRRTHDTLAQAALAVAALAQIPATVIGASPRTGAGSVQQVSNRFPVTVVPADYAFVIWAPIYAGSLALAAYQALPAHRTDPALRRMRLPAAIAYAGNAVWLITFTRQRYTTALACILTTLTASTIAYSRLQTSEQPLTTAQTWVVRAPLGLLAGWITVATPSAVATTVLSAGRDRLGLTGIGWAPTLLTALTGITTAVTRRLPSSLAFPAAVTWGLAGVSANHRVPPVARYTAAIAATVTATAALFHRHQSSRP